MRLRGAGAPRRRRVDPSELGTPRAAGALTLEVNNGADSRWSNTQKRDLRYCVATSFRTWNGQDRYERVKEALFRATAAWEATANVRFVYRGRLR